MIRLSVMYPATPGSHFDWNYYLGPHLKLSRQLLGPRGLVRTEIDRGIGGLPPRYGASLSRGGASVFPHDRGTRERTRRYGKGLYCRRAELHGCAERRANQRSCGMIRTDFGSPTIFVLDVTEMKKAPAWPEGFLGGKVKMELRRNPELARTQLLPVPARRGRAAARSWRESTTK